MLAHSSARPDLTDDQRDELAQLPYDDRALVTPEAFARWTLDLGPDDVVPLADIVRLERSRRRTLQTIRDGAELTDQEFALVRFLQRREGQTITFAQLFRRLWPEQTLGASERALWDRDGLFGRLAPRVYRLVHIIKVKLEVDPLRPQHIATLRGVGYRWYSSPPSRDDREDYTTRSEDATTTRTEIRGWRGQLPPGGPQRGPGGRFRPGPEHPDAIEGEVVDERSRRR